MAATLTLQSSGEGGKAPSAPLFADRVNFQGDTSYPAGGYDMDLSVLKKNKTRLSVIVEGTEGAVNQRVVYDNDNDKIKIFVVSTGAEESAGADVSGITAQLVVLSQ